MAHTPTHPRKKLIEVSIPLEAINKASAREKSIRHGHPSTLHLWWARRPLAACRAVLFAQLVDDPSAWPDRFPTEEAVEAERRRLHRVIEAMVPWEASNDDRILNAARWEIARSVAWGLGEEPPARGDGAAILAYLQEKAPPVYDPFSGGGSIPLEAQRLGLRAYGSDLNPVAVLIGKALVEIPPKFAGRAPVNPAARAEAAGGPLRGWKGAQGLAEDVRHYGQWMRDQAQARIGHLYPKATLPDGSEATVIAWLWARTVRSPDPAAKGAMVPLVSSFMLSTKEGKKSWVEVVIDPDAPDGWRFEVKSGFLCDEDEKRLNLGTKIGRGQFRCVLTGAGVEEGYIRQQSMIGNSSWRPMALVAEEKLGKQYISVGAASVPDVESEFLSGRPHQNMFVGALGFRLQAYGVSNWGQFFRDRQVAAISVFAGLITEVIEVIQKDAKAAVDEGSLVSLDVLDYARSVGAYLLCCLGRAIDYWTINTMWEAGGEFIVHTFSEMTVPIVWDSAEANPFIEGGGGWSKTCLDWVVRVVGALPENTMHGFISNTAAQSIVPPANATFSTDPPYFDNIGYADLSDAFYVWQREVLGVVFPGLGRRLETPKQEELVATSARHGGAQMARNFFLTGMETVFKKFAQTTDVGPISIYYSYKEKGKVGLGSGWEAFLEAIIKPGWQIDASWPIKAERPTRNRSIGKTALASCIVLICRKRSVNAAAITRAEFTRLLKAELPTAVEAIMKAGVGPIDVPQCVVGPGIGVYSRYTRVLEDDDSPMSVKAALAIINRVWGELENEADADYDPETQVALAWFASHGFDARPSGDLITMANAKNISVDGLFRSGVFADLKGKAALTGRAALDPAWSPATDKTPTVWECAQHAARALNSADGGGEAAARLVAQMGPRGDAALALAHRLFKIAEQKGWSQEALVWSELAESWTRLEELASRSDARASVPQQGDLF